MILTQCAVCATELGTGGKRCGRCSTRYCGAECQVQHWKEGGHDQLCKKIKKAGGAEAYNAGKKLKEAIAVAVENCADDTKGQTCYICTQALHWKTKEGLVRMCACRGTAGFAHVSCLAEQAKILFAEAEENNLGVKALNERWHRWAVCGLCEQRYHGVVYHALGWACWKTYVGRPETDQIRSNAMNLLGNGLFAAKHHEDALVLKEAELSMMRRLGAPEENILVTLSNLAMTYADLGHQEKALSMERDVYSGCLKLNGEENENTIRTAHSLTNSLRLLERFDEAKSLLLKMTPVSRRVLGENHDITLAMRTSYASALFEDADATLDDLRESAATLEDTARIARRWLGGAHPLTSGIERELRRSRAALRARDGSSVRPSEASVRAVREALAAMATSDA